MGNIWHKEDCQNENIHNFDARSFMEWYSKLKVDNETDFTSLGPLIAPCHPSAYKIKTIEKYLEGKITMLNEQHGIIDDYIYFNKNSIQSLVRYDAVTVGTLVNVHAYHKTNNCWKAHSVTLVQNRISSWNDLNSTNKKCDSGTIVGIITSLDEAKGCIDENLRFNLADVADSYTPHCYDWVSAMFNADDKSLKDVKPVRILELTGSVTHIPRFNTKFSKSYRKGLINGEICFDLDTCQREYTPHVGDQVVCTAVESKQGRYQFRATSVILMLRHKSRVGNVAITEKAWSVKGIRPESRSQRPSVPSFLPQYPLPNAIYSCVVNGDDILQHLPSLKDQLSEKNFAKRLTGLIHLEEVAAKIETSQYSLKRVSLDSRGEFTLIKVPGIIDGRPDLTIGDVVTLQDLNNKGYSPDYQGFIHHVCVEEEYILVKFHDLLYENCTKQDLFDVFFSYSRTPYRRCILAVEFAQKNFISHFFNVRKKETQKTNLVTLFNEKLNFRQCMAVQNCISLKGGYSPYILFGPPGTGKTVTLVETIIQLIKSKRDSRLLVCAPSNSAVDVICERLHFSGEINAGDMVRFNCLRRVEESIPENVRLYCRETEEVDRIARYRIILTTCVNAGLFYNIHLGNNHFTHVLIDEAGQATEPECMIPIGLGYKGVIILAGDPMQLGPVIKSPIAEHYGFGTSMLERLMNVSNYQKDKETNEYNAKFVTKLLTNYRVIHRGLLSISSEMFYDNELIVDSEIWNESVFKNWSQLKNDEFPILFHGVIGKEMKESGSPSWMNPAEIIQIIRYVKLLISEGKCKASEIGIISPYRKQVQKLRIMLSAVNVNRVKIGTVEEFQGQERSVIILSTVRSQILSKDSGNKQFKVDLGFVSNPKRFNVSITRSKCLLIVVGNPHVLKYDSCWGKLLTFCVSNNSYVGCDLQLLA